MFITKKNLINTALVSLLAVSAGSWAASDTAKINVMATVVNNTCTPAWNADVRDVNMKRVSAKDVANGGGTASKPFFLSLSDCGDSAQKVTVKAIGMPDENNSNLFKNTDATKTAATGVGVSIWAGEGQRTQLKPGGGESAEYTITDAKANMEFIAKVEATGSEGTGIKAGSLSSLIELEVAYQ